MTSTPSKLDTFVVELLNDAIKIWEHRSHPDLVKQSRRYLTAGADVASRVKGACLSKPVLVHADFVQAAASNEVPATSSFLW